MTAPYVASRGLGMVIPSHMVERLRAYIELGHPMGDFLQAVISNDLREACSRADDTNCHILPAYIVYLFNEAPAPCWGSREKYEAWVRKFAVAREKAVGGAS
jgi:hypothetical protein